MSGNHWISKRHMQRGGSIGRGPKSQRALGPLRLIVGYTYLAKGMFDYDQVQFECGHEGRATSGAKRGRCRKCAKLEQVKA